MKNDKNILKETLKEFVPILTFFSLILGFGGLIEFSANGLTKKYAKGNLQDIMFEQEISLFGSGIKHFGVPSLDFEYNIKDMRAGCYEPQEDKIVLNLLLSKNTPGWDIGSDEGKLYADLQDDGARGVIAHELGHYYCDKLSEKIFHQDGGVFGTGLNRRIISEGIAEYFEHSVTGKPNKFKESDWPKSRKQLNRMYKLGIGKNNFIYNGGHMVVKPLIDKYGKKAIEYMIYEPLRDNELLNYKAYQQRIEKMINSSIKENRARSKI